MDWHQVAEGQYKWDENISLEYMSGFMTGKFLLATAKSKPCGLYYKTITVVIMTIISDATIWSVTYDCN